MSGTHSQQNLESYLELNNREQVIRFPLNQPIHRLGRDAIWADLLICDRGWEVLSGRHAVLRRENNHYWIYDGDGESKPSTNGTFIDHSRINLQTGYRLKQNTQLQIGQDPSNLILLTYISGDHSSSKVIPGKFRLNLQDIQQWPVILGREPTTQYGSMLLDAPTVSRNHATLSREANHYILRDLSANGTFVNKQRVKQDYRLKDRDLIQIGPFTLLFQDGILELFDRGNQIRLDADQLFRKVKHPQGEKIILNNVSLAIEPGQLVAIVGGSGAGKSTLMKTLLGIEPLTSGAVLLNGDNLRQNFVLYRSEIGYVPQDDIVHENLTVEEVLSYACQLRLPADTPLQSEVDRTLEQVQLSHVRQTSVHQLSGGQRKRVSIAVELLANPKLFFLDEPTSGLDPGLDKKMMQLLQQLAEQGRTVILVTHATSNLEVCDRIVFMGAGGRLCYFGPPLEAMRFFNMPSSDLKYFANIYIELDQGTENQSSSVQKWSELFRQSEAYQTYIASALSVNQGQKDGNKPRTRSKNSILSLRQWKILSDRYLKLVLRDRFSLGLMLLTAPLGISLITLALQGETPLAKLETLDVMQAPLALRVLFVFTCATLWVGFSGTAQTIVREASIYARERLVNLGLLPYIGSKVIIHAGLAVIQSLLMTGVILLGFDSPKPDLMSWPVGCSLTIFLTLVASFSLGLMISSFVKNTNQANSTLPLILIPQIVFSGVLFKLDGMARFFSWLMLSRWSIGAYGTLVNVNAMVPEQPQVSGVKPTPLPFEPTSTYDPTWENLLLNWGILGLHSLIYLGLTLWRQKRKDIY